MKTTLLAAAFVIAIGWTISSASDKPQARTFGPEWTKDKSGDFYTRKHDAEVLRRADANFKSTRYTLATEFDMVRVSERDENRGIGVEVGNSAETADAILTLLRNPAMRQRLGAAGRARVSARFSETAAITRLLDLYRHPRPVAD